MSTTAIRVRNLGKQYQIGARERGYATFREALVRAARAPFERFRRLSGRTGADESFWALQDVSFDVQEGEVIGIIGRNGAGKSTLLKVLSQITEPTTGEVELHGRVASLLEVGTGFHPELTGRENIYLNGAILGMKREEITRRFDEIVAFAEVEKFLDTPVKRYSSGMYVRLAFAVAAHLEPELLIIDEVLAVGDYQFQEKCLGRMKDVAGQGRTVLVVSHNMATICSLCSRTIVLSQGRCVYNGATRKGAELYAATATAQSEFDPRNCKRQGNGLIKIAGFSIRPSILRTHEKVTFEFKLERSTSWDGEIPFDIAVAVNSLTHPVGQIYSRHTLAPFRFRGDTMSISAHVDRLPLVPGKYLLNLWVGSGMQPIDWIVEALIISVETGHGDGRQLLENRGYPVILSASWA